MGRIITIARGMGSGGKTIGKMLAKELDIPYYDKEIIRMASDESGINEKLFGRVDEKIKNTIFKSLTIRISPPTATCSTTPQR